MKLCSICDKKIEGSWCKTCHRFVKTYELSDRIHLNESHNPKNDKDCTYHTMPNNSGTEYGTQAAVNRTTASRTYRQSTMGTSANTSAKKKGPKIVTIIVIAYVVLMCLGIIIPIISSFVREISDEVREEFRNEYEYDDSFLDDESLLDPDVELLLTDMRKKIAEMDEVEPVEVSEEEDYEFRYYEPADIEDLGFACSEEHFDWDISGFEAWLDKNWTTGYEMEEESSPYYNYFYKDEDYTWLYFATFRDYFATDDFAVRAGYDTGTGELHMIGFVSVAEVDYTDLYFKILQKLDPETEWNEEIFEKALYESLDAGEYTTFYASDAVEIDAEIKEGYYSVTFYPSYAE